METFEKSWRADGALRSTGPVERSDRWESIREAWGPMNPVRYAESGDGSLTVLCEPEPGKDWRTMRFVLDVSQPEKLQTINIKRVQAP